MGADELKEALRRVKREMLKVFRARSVEGEEFEVRLRREWKKEKQAILA